MYTGKLTFRRIDYYFVLLELQHVLYSEREKDSTACVMLTGNGPYFSSGNDLSGFAAALGSGMTPAELADGAFDIMIPFVDAFIDFDKFTGQKSDWINFYTVEAPNNRKTTFKSPLLGGSTVTDCFEAL